MADDSSDKPVEVAPKKLTAKQEAFIHHYVRCNNATKAAKLAGYSEDSATIIGYENLTKPYIKERVDAERALRLKRVGVEPNRILNELARIAFSDYSDYAYLGEYGFKAKLTSSYKKGRSKAIAEIVSADGVIKIKLHDKLKALELLGKHLNLFTDKAIVSGEISVEEIVLPQHGTKIKITKS